MNATNDLERHEFIATHAPEFLSQILKGALAAGKVLGDGYGPHSAKLAVDAARSLFDELERVKPSQRRAG